MSNSHNNMTHSLDTANGCDALITGMVSQYHVSQHQQQHYPGAAGDCQEVQFDVVDRPPQVRHSRAFRNFKNPPQPHFCIRAMTFDGYEVFINAMTWNRIVMPENANDPIPLYGGMRIPTGNPRAPMNVYAVMANPEILKDVGRNCPDLEEMVAMVDLMCDFVEAMNPGLKLTRNAAVLKDRDLSGELKDIWSAVQIKRENEKKSVAQLANPNNVNPFDSYQSAEQIVFNFGPESAPVYSDTNCTNILGDVQNGALSNTLNDLSAINDTLLSTTDNHNVVTPTHHAMEQENTNESNVPYYAEMNSTDLEANFTSSTATIVNTNTATTQKTQPIAAGCQMLGETTVTPSNDQKSDSKVTNNKVEAESPTQSPSLPKSKLAKKTDFSLKSSKNKPQPEIPITTSSSATTVPSPGPPGKQPASPNNCGGNQTQTPPQTKREKFGSLLPIFKSKSNSEKREKESKEKADKEAKNAQKDKMKASKNAATNNKHVIENESSCKQQQMKSLELDMKNIDLCHSNNDNLMRKDDVIVNESGGIEMRSTIAATSAK